MRAMPRPRRKWRSTLARFHNTTVNDACEVRGYISDGATEYMATVEGQTKNVTREGNVDNTILVTRTQIVDQE